jgi:hypothetical protein
MRWLLALWLPWAILIDYVSLFKTRVILRILGQTNLQICAIAILCIDIFVYRPPIIGHNSGRRVFGRLNDTYYT